MSKETETEKETKVVELKLEVPAETCVLLISAADAEGNELEEYDWQVEEVTFDMLKEVPAFIKWVEQEWNDSFSNISIEESIDKLFSEGKEEAVRKYLGR